MSEWPLWPITSHSPMSHTAEGSPLGDPCANRWSETYKSTQTKTPGRDARAFSTLLPRFRLYCHVFDFNGKEQTCGRKIKCHPNYRTLQRSNSCKNPFKTMTYFNSAICKRFVGMEAGIIKVSS
ncbi:protein of unknown function [Thauera humireducens]|nr:protein of unknown function [Thauera humireducens]